MSLRTEWKFEYNGSQLLEATKKRIAHHQERKEQWTTWLNEAKQKLENAGVTLVENEYTTGPDSVQIKIDPELQTRHYTCREKVKGHIREIEQYQMWERAFEKNKDIQIELDVHDIDFFGL